MVAIHILEFEFNFDARVLADPGIRVATGGWQSIFSILRGINRKTIDWDDALINPQIVVRAILFIGINGWSNWHTPAALFEVCVIFVFQPITQQLV